MACHFRSVVIAMVLCVASSAVAHAETPETTATREAEARFEEGKRLYREKKDFEGARLKFAQAYALNPSAAILWNLAISELDAGRALEAVNHFRAYGKHADAKSSNRDSMPDLMRRARKELARIHVEAPSGTEILVDGKAFAERAPLAEPLDVTPGHHVVVLRHGSEEKRFEVDAAADRDPAIVRLAGPAAASLPKMEATPVVEPTPLPKTDRVDTNQDSSARLVTTIVLGGVGAIALGTGVAFGVMARSEGNRAIDIRDAFVKAPVAANEAATRASFQEAADAESRNATLSNVFFVGGGVLAAGAVAAYVFWPTTSTKRTNGSKSPTSATFLPWTSPQSVGATTTVSF